MFKERKIQYIHLRYILNSNADKAIEAEVILKSGHMGKASSPTAILPGKRERRLSCVSEKKELERNEEQLKDVLLKNELTQKTLDGYLSKLVETVGTDVCLAVSLAFARAVAMSENIDLVTYVFILLDLNTKMRMPRILIPVFSGGVHQKGQANSLQQMMVGIQGNSLEESYQISRGISNEAEKKLKEKGAYIGVASSGGYLTTGLSLDEKFLLLQEILEDVRWKKCTFPAIDVAAEHLKVDSFYSLDGRLLSPKEFYMVIIECIRRFSIGFVEDPFDSTDIDLWKRLRNEEGERIQIIADDLFATQEKYVDSKLATGAVVKMNQVGNLSDTLNMIRALKKYKMTMCISHRSYETEDTAMCDVAVAASSEYIKIGSVRKGERIIKYNQLLRLEEKI